MNVQSLSRIAPLFLIAVAIVLFVGASHAAHSGSAQARYQECTSLAASNPSKGLEKAKAWRATYGASPAARHCEALALYGMKNYEEAADLLMALAKDTAATKPALSLNLLGQAIDAYRMLNQPNNGINAASDMLILPNVKWEDPERAQILGKRAMLLRETKKPLDAIQDLDQALSLTPKNADLLTERAKAYLALGNTDSAKKDLDAAVNAEPAHKEAKRLLADIKS